LPFIKKKKNSQLIKKYTNVLKKIMVFLRG